MGLVINTVQSDYNMGHKRVKQIGKVVMGGASGASRKNQQNAFTVSIEARKTTAWLHFGIAA